VLANEDDEEDDEETWHEALLHILYN
jgi:hypothetical protein